MISQLKALKQDSFTEHEIKEVIRNILKKHMPALLKKIETDHEAQEQSTTMHGQYARDIITHVISVYSA